MIEVITKIILNSIKDEGRSFEIGLQDQVSNHLIVMDIKSICGERMGRRWNIIHQVCTEKMNESEPPMKCRKCRNIIETKLLAMAWQRIWKVPVYCPSGGRHIGGMSRDPGFYREHVKCRLDVKGETQVAEPQELEYQCEAQGRINS